MAGLFKEGSENLGKGLTAGLAAFFALEAAAAGMMLFEKQGRDDLESMYKKIYRSLHGFKLAIALYIAFLAGKKTLEALNK